MEVFNALQSGRKEATQQKYYESLMAQQIQKRQIEQQQQQQATRRQQATEFLSVSNTLSSTPESQKAEVYNKKIRPALSELGADMSKLPLEYNDETAQAINDEFGSETVESRAILGLVSEQEQYDRRQDELDREETARQDRMKNMFEERRVRVAERKKAEGARDYFKEEEEKALGKAGVKRLVESKEKSELAQNQLYTLEEMGKAISNPDVYVGTGAGYVKDVKDLASSLGFEVKGKKEAQIIESFGNQLAMQLRNPKSGMGLPGNVSDKDIQFLKKAVPTIGKTREGNLELIRMMRTLLNRQIEMADLKNQYLSKRGTLRGFEKYKKEYVDNNSLYVEKEGGGVERVGGDQKAIEELRRRGVK